VRLIGELRVAIPRAIVGHDAGWFEAYGWAVLGNLIPVVLLILYLGPGQPSAAGLPQPG
jgi:hypothetical protein